MIAGVVSYMLLLCRGGVAFAGLVSLTSPYPSELFVLGGGLVCLQGFACVCVGLAHLVLRKWFCSILLQFLGCLGVLVPGVCVCVCVCVYVCVCVCVYV